MWKAKSRHRTSKGSKFLVVKNQRCILICTQLMPVFNCDYSMGSSPNFWKGYWNEEVKIHIWNALFIKETTKYMQVRSTGHCFEKYLEKMQKVFRYLTIWSIQTTQSCKIPIERTNINTKASPTWQISIRQAQNAQFWSFNWKPLRIFMSKG